MKTKINLSPIILFLTLCLLVLWVYWLPAASKAYFFRYEPNVPNPDFAAYYVAGQALDKGYNPYLDNHEADPALFDVRQGGFSRFIYPPTMVPFYSLLGRLPYKYARAVWLFLNLGIFATGFLALFLRVERRLRFPFFAFAALLALTSQPLLFHIQQGQVDLLTAGLGMIAWGTYQARHKTLSALALALAVLTKVSPVVLLAALVLFYGDWKFLLRFGILCAVLLGLSLLVVPFQYYLDFINLILPIISSGRGYFVNQSLIRLVAYAGLLPKILSAVGFCGMALLAWLAGRKPAAEQPVWLAPLVFLINILVMLLFSGVAWHMAYVWLIFPSALLLIRVYDQARPWFLSGLGLALILINSTVDEAWYLHSTNLAGGCILLGLGLLLLCAPRLALRPGENELS